MKKLTTLTAASVLTVGLLAASSGPAYATADPDDFDTSELACAAGRNLTDFTNNVFDEIDGGKLLIDGTNFTVVVGTDSADFLKSVNGKDSIIFGLAGADVIKAGKRDEIVCAGDGDDTAFAGKGNTDIFGGPGRDVLIGAKTDDLIVGETGNDFITGSAGNDILDGGPGDDVILAGKGTDTVDGGGDATSLGDLCEKFEVPATLGAANCEF